MAASLPSCSSLLLAAAQLDSSDDLLTTLLVLTLFVLLGVAILWLVAPAHAKAPLRGSQAPRASRPPTGAPRVVARVTPTPAPRRRVIRLHAATPGQAAHEYNIGDSSGTRGSALVRAA